MAWKSDGGSSLCLEKSVRKYPLSHTPNKMPEERFLFEVSSLERATSGLKVKESLCGQTGSSENVTKPKNDLSEVSDTVQVSEVPVGPNPTSFLGTDSIIHKRPRSLLPRASSFDHSNKIRDEVVVSPFENMTSSGKSPLLKGARVGPPSDVQTVEQSVDTRISQGSHQFNSVQRQSKDEKDNDLQLTQFFRDSVKGSLDQNKDEKDENKDRDLQLTQFFRDSVKGSLDQTCSTETVSVNPMNVKETGASGHLVSSSTDIVVSEASNSISDNGKSSLKSNVPKWVCQHFLQPLWKEEQRKVNDGEESNESYENECSVFRDEAVNSSCKKELPDVNSKSLFTVEEGGIDKRNIDSMVEPGLNFSNTNVSLRGRSPVSHVKLIGDNMKAEKDNRVKEYKTNTHKETEKIKKRLQRLNASFMSDARDIWTDEKTCDLVEGEFSFLLQNKPVHDSLNIANLYRVYVTGEKISDEKVIVNQEILRTYLNAQVTENMKTLGMKATRIQAYAWPSINSGSHTVIVGNRYSGKTFGYLIPLISTLIDSWQNLSKRLVTGIGAVMVIVCNDWRRAKCAAEFLVSLLPGVQLALKVMTAWGGCGSDKVKVTKMQLLEGCDILITTPPCLIRLIRGNSVSHEKEHHQEEKETPSTALNRCCYFVIDDADLILDHFASNIRQLLKWWGEGSPVFLRQLVVTSSAWTPILDAWIRKLSELRLRIIISSPEEAAICSCVTTKIHHVFEKQNILMKIVNLIRDNFREKRNLVFVKQDEGALLKNMLSDASVYCVVVTNTLDMWELRRLVHQWHEVQALTMIISEDSVYQLLHHDLANADAIFHSYIPKVVSKFTLRYAFMVSNFPDLQNASSSCESHVFLTESDAKSRPRVLLELSRLCRQAPQPLLDLVPQLIMESRKHRVLCYYVKAYGSCPEKDHCKFRHHIRLCDIPQELPRFGEVSFSVIKVINASRFLVRLTEYRENSDSPKVNLECHYLKLFCSLQEHYGDKTNHQRLEYAEVGMLCVIRDREKWVRAKMDSIDYSKDKVYITVFLVDEGSEMTVALKSALEIHPKFSKLPGLLVECYLCCVKPCDHDTEWTLHASQYVNSVFKSHAKNTKLSGRIALALNLTLWLSPVVEVIRIGGVTFQKGSLRSRLITNGYGEENSEHLKSLEEQCTKAGISLAEEDLDNSKWMNWLNHANELLDNCNTSILKVEKEESMNVAVDICPHMGQMREMDDGNDALQSVGDDDSQELNQKEEKEITELSGVTGDETKVPYTAEELPLHCQLEIKVAHVNSDDLFYVQKVNKIDR